jgi:hypothetical protein
VTAEAIAKALGGHESVTPIPSVGVEPLGSTLRVLGVPSSMWHQILFDLFDLGVAPIVATTGDWKSDGLVSLRTA